MNTTNLAKFPRYATAERQVREDPGVYTPDPPTDADSNSGPKAHTIAEDHAKHLYGAQRLVGEALNLSGLMLASLHDECDSRAMQIQTTLKVIENKLKKAYNRIDRHEVRHTNLFLAYVDLKKKGSEEAPS